LVKPLTTHDVANAVETQVPATLLFESIAITVYPVIADPLLFAGGFHSTVADASPATAVTESGTDGAALIATHAEAVDAAEGPAALVAATLNV
jgi:hypothetical protein